MYPNDTTQDIPYGYCHCGCGQKTKIAPQNLIRLGWIKGEPIRYITGHNKPSKRKPYVPWHLANDFAPWVARHGLRVPYGKCQCGCGEDAPIAKQNEGKLGLLKGHPRRYAIGHNTCLPLKEKFWANVDKRSPDECWLWTGDTAGRGYGRMCHHTKVLRAHRLSYELHYGPIPKGLFVCHNCPEGDNPSCVNPAHLFLGTSQENTDDMIKKGRAAPPKGEASSFAKLTATQVIAIRHRAKQGESKVDLAREYGVLKATISDILTHRTWRHIP